MAMYYQSSSSEIQGGDGVHTLYLMNPNYVGGGGGGYSLSDNQPNMLFFNPPAAAAMAQPHHFVDPAPRHHYATWGTAALLDDDMPQQTPRGLSLSLSDHHKTGGDRDHFPAGQMISPSRNSSPPSLTTTEPINGVNTMQSVMIMGSKYLKAAQELLDEVVNVGTSETKTLRPDKPPPPPPKVIKEDKSGAAELSLTTAQRQEIQMKKAKLNSMLDEVEQRCRQYNQQMQIIVASFEQAAGIGSAKSYTQLALKTILKQFKCLKSTISAQIKGLNKSLGEEEGSDNKPEGPTGLRFVDHQLRRQQRALQQLGVMPNNAWRPQRGLPERAVSVLRAWLFEHFLHPYPKDSDKQMLAKQTGLTRSQVSNWFINARVRLWKPMVEEMYLEETKNNQNQIPIDGGAASIKPEPDNKTPRATAPPPPPPEISAAPPLPSRTNFAQLISSLNMENLPPEKSPKKLRNTSFLSADDHDQATAIKRFSGTEINYLSMPAAAENDHVNRYVGADQQLAAGGFGLQGNGFSLSLGLPPTDHHRSQQNFFSHRNFELVEGGGIGGEGGGAAAASHQSIAYEILDFQSRKPFPAQLLPDFVA